MVWTRNIVWQRGRFSCEDGTMDSGFTMPELFDLAVAYVRCALPARRALAARPVPPSPGAQSAHAPVRFWPRDGGAKEQLAGKKPFSTDELLQFYGCVDACLRGRDRCGAFRAGALLMFPRWLWRRKQVVQAGNPGRLQHSAARRLEHRGAGQVERMEQDEGPVSRRMPFPLPRATLR